MRTVTKHGLGEGRADDLLAEQSPFTHHVVAEAGADFRSRQYDEGETPFTIVVRKPGRIAYMCTLHAGIVGAIQVTR